MRVLYQVDAFTSLPFSGNPAGVVLAADGLTDGQMLAVARELNNSETAFVLAPDSPGHDVRIRFFTPTTESRPADTPRWRPASPGPSSTGCPPARWCRSPAPGCGSGCGSTGDRLRIGMHQGAAVFGPELDGSATGRLLHALGAAPRDLADSGPVQIVSTGHAKVLVELRDRAAVDRLRPDPAALTALSRDIDTNGFFVFGGRMRRWRPSHRRGSRC
ncbi:Uncharacterized isomerase CA_C3446 [Streptomyces leeuwenhoekii]|uniref:Uncharacterized isomerase CA_C3446 n=1 Tax=Streptomyces leeuwenhoekii TaxID=1437453 RepID=A0A0F7VQJ8_STRLW|nr:Uncharacterized isomerase CA_C3446 [Streptomyces leeuwenhoekii]